MTFGNMKRRVVLKQQSSANRFLSERAKTIFAGGKIIGGLLVAPIFIAILLIFALCSPPCLLGSFSSVLAPSSPLAVPSFPAATAFSAFPVTGGARYRSIRTPNNSNPNSHRLYAFKYKPVVVVGKIIIDEYGDPFPDSNDENHKQNEVEPAPPKTVSIGGGGPQAAFGAAAALAVWDSYYRNKDEGDTVQTQTPPIPPVVFVAPVGKDWTCSETAALESSIGASTSVVFHINNCTGAVSGKPVPDVDVANHNHNHNHAIIKTHLVRSRMENNEKDNDNDGFFTPRIRLWHDRDQIVHWYALNDSFGPNGADGLWRNNPSSENLSSILEGGGWNANGGDGDDDGVVVHAIAEAWTGAAGGGLDFLPLVQDELLLHHISFVGIEPVASGESVTKEDAECAASILQTCCETIEESASFSVDTVFWCPDRDLDQAMRKHGLFCYNYESDDEIRRKRPLLIAATRDGPRGSTVEEFGGSERMVVPAASLKSKDGAPLDPTGAGNAYSGAMTALLGNGISPLLAACIASGVGAVVCEHEGLPPPREWLKTLDRIASAAKEIESKLLLPKEELG